MVAAGSLACVLVVVTTVVDREAIEGEMGSGIVFTRQGVGLLAGSATGLAMEAWMVGPCVDNVKCLGTCGGRRAGCGVVVCVLGRALCAHGVACM